MTENQEFIKSIELSTSSVEAVKNVWTYGAEASNVVGGFRRTKVSARPFSLARGVAFDFAIVRGSTRSNLVLYHLGEQL
jgi:hypothetical protein